MPHEPMFENITRKDAKLVIPKFLFRALHPDAFYPSRKNVPLRSVFRGMGLHSRLVVTGHMLGMSAQEIACAFHRRTYEQAGYFSVFESERDALLANFAEAGIDISADFDGWMARGDFLYSSNHPKAFVFADILLRALSGRFLPAAEHAHAREILAQVPDYLEDSIRWPVYPEIAAHHGFEGSLSWRLTEAAGGASLALGQFVLQSFEILDGEAPLPRHVVPGFEMCADALRSRL
ncbi:MAG TPA: WcbI family polysaccharide biosynthesis putative acetyltransferase [Rhizomicrobium sp.]|nr:WcbI family polysaccharide biosynthesis putative acetyltransferase [Rhizomicrobium sp.]